MARTSSRLPGPRGCVGEHFALLEAVVLLAALLPRHEVTSMTSRLDIEPMITLRPKGAVPALLIRR
jgi:cytochrome P450